VTLYYLVATAPGSGTPEIIEALENSGTPDALGRPGTLELQGTHTRGTRPVELHPTGVLMPFYWPLSPRPLMDPPL